MNALRSPSLHLLAAALVALVWANVAGDSYTSVWGAHAVHAFVNDGLMTVFFFVAGLEIKRELFGGELSDRRAAALPVCAAVGGMVVPALVFFAIAGGTAAGRGWGIPVATDIAFALGVLGLFAKRIPQSLRIFLLALAIVDDIGGIAIIAIFYAHGGVHPSIFGVLAAFLIPSRLGARVEPRLVPVVAHVVLPVFALANAGVALRRDTLDAPGAGQLVAAVVAGLVVGKAVGIVAGAWVGVRLRIATLPRGVDWPMIVGVAAVGGIGFTVALFITDLAFDDHGLTEAARLGVVAASLCAAIVGAGVLHWATRRRLRLVD